MAARGRVTRNTDPHQNFSKRPPATRGPSADRPPPIADHKAIAFVRAGPAHSAVIRARVVGYAMPAEMPPRMRAKMRKPSDGAYAAAMDAGIDSETPRTSIILRPYRSPSAPRYSTEAARARE